MKNSLVHVWSTKYMKPIPYALNNCLRVTLSPKVGDATSVRGHARNLLVAIQEGKAIDSSRYMLSEMQEACCNTSRSLPYACYIQFLVEQVTKKTFFKEISHNSYVPQHKPLQNLMKEVERIRKSKEQPQDAPVQDQDQTPPVAPSTSAPSSSQVPAPPSASTLISEAAPQVAVNVVAQMALELQNLKKDFRVFQDTQAQMLSALQVLTAEVAKLVSSSKPAEDPAPPRSS